MRPQAKGRLEFSGASRGRVALRDTLIQNSGLWSWETTIFCGFKSSVCDDFLWQLQETHPCTSSYRRGTPGNVWKHIWKSQWRAVTGVQWVEAKEAANVLGLTESP